MSYLLISISTAAAQWTAALRGLADNPLWRLQALLLARLKLRSSLISRSPLLAWIGLLLGGFVVWLNVELLLELRRVGPISYWEAALYQYGTLHLLWFAATLFAACWAAAALYSALREALAALRRDPQGRQELASDSLLRLSALSPAEVLLPLLLSGLRRLWLPHLLLYALAALAVQRTVAAQADPLPGWPLQLGHFAAVLAMYSVGGLLCALALLLLAAGLGRGLQGKLLPSIGAGVWVVLPPVLGVLVLQGYTAYYDSAGHRLASFFGYGTLFVLCLFPLLRLALNCRPLRVGLSLSLPLLYPLILLTLQLSLSLWRMDKALQITTVVATSHLFAIFFWQLVEMFPYVGSTEIGLGTDIPLHAVVFAQLPAQLLLLIAALLFAHYSAARWLAEDAS